MAQSILTPAQVIQAQQAAQQQQQAGGVPDYLSDEDIARRQRFIQALSESGLQGGPTASPWGAVGRIASALSGAYLAKKEEQRASDRNSLDASDLAKALSAQQASPEQAPLHTVDVQGGGVAGMPGGVAAPLQGSQAPAMDDSVKMQRKPLMDAIMGTNNPDIINQYAPALLQDRMRQEAEANSPHTYQPGDVVYQGGKQILSVPEKKKDQFRPATAADLVGYPKGTAAEVNTATNELANVHVPPDNSLGWANLSETQRHNKTEEAGKVVDAELLAPQAMAIANYRQAPPSTRTAQNPSGAALMGEVYKINPEWNANYYEESKAAQRSYSAAHGDQIRFASNALQHMDVMDQLAKALGNGDNQLINAARQKWKEVFGSDAPTNIQEAAQIVGPEISKAIAGVGGGSAEERKGLADAYVQYRAPEQIIRANNVARSLLVGQVRSMKKQYEATTRDKSADGFNSMLLPETQALIENPLPLANAPAGGIVPTNIQKVSTPEEAMKLPPGTKFMTPDGRVKVR